MRKTHGITRSPNSPHPFPERKGSVSWKKNRKCILCNANCTQIFRNVGVCNLNTKKSWLAMSWLEIGTCKWKVLTITSLLSRWEIGVTSHPVLVITTTYKHQVLYEYIKVSVLDIKLANGTLKCLEIKTYRFSKQILNQKQQIPPPHSAIYIGSIAPLPPPSV